VPCLGNANCLIFSAHIFSLWAQPSLSCILHLPSFHTFSLTFDCLTRRRTASLLHDVKAE
jgi:hypothetical protein